MNDYDVKILLDTLDTAKIYAGAELGRLCNNNQHIDACVFQSIRDSIARNIKLLQSYMICNAESEGSEKVYKKVAKELLDAFIEDKIAIIGEFSINTEQSYNWLNKEVIKYAERLDENVDEWVKRIKAAREGGL